MYALRCENLSRVFGRKKVLNDVSVALLPGEVFWLGGAQCGPERSDVAQDIGRLFSAFCRTRLRCGARPWAPVAPVRDSGA